MLAPIIKTAAVCDPFTSSTTRLSVASSSILMMIGTVPSHGCQLVANIAGFLVSLSSRLLLLLQQGRFSLEGETHCCAGAGVVCAAGAGGGY